MVKTYNITTDETFDILLSILEDESRATILTIPGVFEILSEHYNNEIIKRFTDKHEKETHHNEPERNQE